MLITHMPAFYIWQNHKPCHVMKAWPHILNLVKDLRSGLMIMITDAAWGMDFIVTVFFMFKIYFFGNNYK